MIPSGYGEILNFEAEALRHQLNLEVRRVRVRIFKKDYSGAVTNIEGAGQDAFNIEYGRQQEFLYESIVTSRATLDLHVTNSTQAGIIEDIFGSEYDEYIMAYDFSLDGTNFTPYWSGYLNTGFYEEQFRAFPYTSSIKASCGLSILKDIPYDGSIGQSLFEIIRDILEPIQRDLGYSISDRIYSTIFDSSESLDDPNEQSFIDASVYNDGQRSSYDVLSFLLQSKLLTISVALGRWQIWNRDNLRLGGDFVRRLYTPAGIRTTAVSGNRDRNISCGAGQQLKWLSTPNRQLTLPVDRVSIRYEFDEVSSLEETNWVRGVDWTGPNSTPDISLAGWSFTGQAYDNGQVVKPQADTINMEGGGSNGTNSLRMTVPFLGVPITDPVPNVDTLSFIRRTNYPVLSVDDDLRLRFQLRLRVNLSVNAIAPPDGDPGGLPEGDEIQPNRMPMYVQVECGDFQLDADGSWVENPASDIYNAIRDSGGNLIAPEDVFEWYEFETDPIPANESMNYRITTGVDTAGDDEIRAIDSVDIDTINILFIDADGNERSLDSLQYVATKQGVTPRRTLQLGPFLHGDGPIGGYPGAIRTEQAAYTRLWDVTAGSGAKTLYQFLADDVLLQKGQPRVTLQGSLIGRADYSNALIDGQERFFSQYMRLRPCINQIDVFAERVTRFTFAFNETIIEAPGPVRSQILRSAPNMFTSARRAVSVLNRNGEIRASARLEESVGANGTLSKRISGLMANGDYKKTQEAPTENKVDVEIKDGLITIYDPVLEEKIQIGWRTAFALFPALFMDNTPPGSSGADSVSLDRTGIGFSSAAGFNFFASAGLLNHNGDIQTPIVELSAFSGPQNNYEIGSGNAFTIESTGISADNEITGIAGGTSGRRITLINRGSISIQLMNQDTGSQATNRIIAPGGNAFQLGSNESVDLIYDLNVRRWRVLST